ncbi:hypothetical protein G4B88_026263, partial [Cannabis sativa]
MGDVLNLCVKGCGFYGRAQNRNMCSKCYKDFIMEEIISKSLSNIHLSSDTTSITTLTFNDTNENDAITNSLSDQFKDLKITKNRCNDCNKKVGLTGFSCRCGNLYCGHHRLPEAHACTYDFKGAARQNLKLPLCFKDFILEEIICESLSNIHLSSNTTSIIAPISTTDENDAITNSLCDQFKSLKVTTNRCKYCNKKVGLTGFTCRCGNLYCGCHRLPETHACTYDFKGAARQNFELTLIC